MFITVLVFGYFVYKRNQSAVTDEKIAAALSDPSLQTFTESDLAVFDGTDPEKPIYIGLDGFVYDVSAGRKFYEEGAGYHYLAGKDSSEDLAIAGGEIIKAKYPIVGKL